MISLLKIKKAKAFYSALAYSISKCCCVITSYQPVSIYSIKN
jgi:hypothetical protein